MSPTTPDRPPARQIRPAKAAGALQKYGVDAVCSNQLQTIRDVVTVVARDPAAQGVAVAKAEIAGDEAEPVAVEGVVSYRVERGSRPSIDPALVEVVAGLHSEHIASGAPAVKRPRT